ncbi:MAG: hypothetical protein ACR2PM_13405 [Hyphomicrobiales bacterium]
MRRKLAITVIALALAFMPCAKVAYALAAPGAPLPSDVTEVVADAGSGAEAAKASSSDQICTKCCSKWRGVVHRAEPLSVPQASKYLPASDWFAWHDGRDGALVRSLLGARSPPPPAAGSSYKAVYARTSRFLN